MTIEDGENLTTGQPSNLEADLTKPEPIKPNETPGQPQAQEIAEIEESLIPHEEDAILENWIRRDLEDSQKRQKRQEPPVATTQQAAQIQECFEVCTSVILKVSGEQVAGEPGIYISASDKSFSNFGKEQWTRDGSFTAQVETKLGNFQAVKAFLAKKLDAQKPDGELPIRHEKMHHTRRMAPGFRTLKTLGLDLLTREEFAPVYGSGKRISQTDSRDTAPIFTLAFCEYAENSQDNEFTKKYYQQVYKVLDREFRLFSDPQDSMIVGKKGLEDWEDSILRDGKLANVNILMYAAVFRFAKLSKKLRKKEEEKTYVHRTGHYREEAKKLGDLSEKIKQSIMSELWDEEKGHFIARPEDDRFDTTANIFASLYLLNPAKREDRDKMVRIQDAIHRKVETPYGLRNFDRPYPHSMMALGHKYGGILDYHNTGLWPWVWGYNIVAKGRLLAHMRDEDEQETRNQLKQEVIDDLVGMAELFEISGKSYEVYFGTGQKIGQPMKGKFIGATVYRSEPNFAGSAASFLLAAYTAERLGLFPTLPKTVTDQKGNKVPY